MAEILNLLSVDFILTSLIIKIVIFLVTLWSILFCIKSRREVSQWILKSISKSEKLFASPFTYLAKTWYGAVGLYLGVLGVTFLARDVREYKELVVLFFLTTVVLVLFGVLFIKMPHMMEATIRFMDKKLRLTAKRKGVYNTLFSSVVNLILFVFGGLLLAELWEVEVLKEAFALEHSVIFVKSISVILVISIGFILWEVFEYFLEEFLEKRRKASASRASRGRIRTLVPVVRNAFRVMIIILISLIVFSELGLDIMPLIAGASVLGIALSLGGQTLVKDIITGTFILIEDTMNIGDFISVNGMNGRVESLSLRTVHLRDRHGQVHIIPFSSIGSFTNMTRDYMYCNFDIMLSYEEDEGRVIPILIDVVEKMRKEDEFKDIIHEPMESRGIQSFEPYGYYLRARMKVAPNHQWSISREFNARVKKAFDENGIHFPYPHQVVQFVDGKSFSSNKPLKKPSKKGKA